MALKDDINNLPSTVSDGTTGHLQNHATIHAGLKDHEARLAGAEGRITDALKITKDTSVGTTIKIGTDIVMGDTGWRDITSLMNPVPNSGGIRIRRTANRTIIYSWYALYSPGVSATIQLPDGYYTGLNESGTLTDNAGATCATYTLTYNGLLTLTWTVNKSAMGTVDKFNTRPWPTSLIGTAA